MVLDGKKFGCVYFEEDERIWVIIGLIVVIFVGDMLVCELMYVIFFVLLYEFFVVVESEYISFSFLFICVSMLGW